MKLTLYQVDAFTAEVFGGNPAAVCVLDNTLEEELMQRIAQENNLAETAFVLPHGDDYHIRWFTPEVEVALCGHATLASAFILFNHFKYNKYTIRFISNQSGELSVTKEKEGWLTLDFPSYHISQVKEDTALIEAIGLIPNRIYKGATDYLLIYNSQLEIEKISPNFHLLHQLDCRGIIVSAPGDAVDFVSRFFAPQCGIPEDPVTGSAHTTLIPYWARQLGKANMTAVQLSKRKGTLKCTYLGERVKISGQAALYLKGEIFL